MLPFCLTYTVSCFAEKQRNAIDMYYNEDLSLSEIADVIDISRQGVRESIKQEAKSI